MKLSKSPPLILLSNTASFKTVEPIADQCATKHWSLIRPQKFFSTFTCLDDLRVFLKRKEKIKKKIFFASNFFQIFFSEIFSKHFFRNIYSFPVYFRYFYKFTDNFLGKNVKIQIKKDLAISKGYLRVL